MCYLVKMALPITVEHKLKVIDDAIMRKKMIADGQSPIPFTAEENMKIYVCVYALCTIESKDFASQLYEKYVNCVKERIMEKVLPPLMDKCGETLLSEIIRTWSDLKAFTNSIYKIFDYLDRFHVPSKGLAKLGDAPRFYFCNMVCNQLYRKLQGAAMSLITEEREGRQIDRDLLKRFFSLFIEVGGKGLTDYYENFEQVMLAEAAAYYSQLSLECWFWRDSFTNYLRKVDWCLVQEEARAEVYPRPATKAKLQQVVKYILVERNAKKWTQNLTTEELVSQMQNLSSKYTSLSLEEGTSGSAAAPATSSR